jgi:hypothetical protein
MTGATPGGRTSYWAYSGATCASVLTSSPGNPRAKSSHDGEDPQGRTVR